MVSAQIAGQLKVYLVSPSGTQRLVKSAAVYWWGPGGSSSGTIANTPEKWNYLPLSVDAGTGGYSILVTFIAGTAATTDVSDAVWILPVQVDGSDQTVGNDDAAGGVGNDNFIVDLSPADGALIAGVETPIQKLRAKDGIKQFRIGGGRVFMTIEDNA